MGFFSDMFKGSGGQIVSGALGAVGGLIGNAQKQAFAREQLQYQQDLHRNQIQWRVEDAKRAGVHPMAALGLSSMSFSPVSSPDYDNWLGEIGQNIDRAIQQGKTREEREQAQALQDRLTGIQIRKGEAEADLAETEAATARFRLQQQLFPAPPPANRSTGIISGQGDAPYSLDTPYGKDLYNLFTIARHGDTLTEVPHPDIADSVTESEWKNIIAHIDAELQAETGAIKPPVYLLTPSERKAVREHRYELVRVPGIGWKLDRNPSRTNPYDKLSKYEKFKRQSTLRYGKDRQSVSGKIFW